MKKSAIILLLFLGLFSNANAQSSDVSKQLRKLKQLLSTMDLFYVDSVNVEHLTEVMVKAALKELDPHSVYIPKKDVQAANEPLKGNFEGVGIQFNIHEDTLLVVAPIIGGPSEKLGIMAGDKILTIEKENVAGVGLKNKDVVDKLRGKKGTKVTVEIKRGDEKELIPYTITRDKIPIYSVDAAYMIDQTSGYIKLSRFAATTMKEISEKLTMLKSKGMQNLVLDLTGNTGGYLHIANQLADQFLGSGELIVYTKGKYFSRRDNKASALGAFEKGKVVVMIDASSASASEIVSGALQDHDRGLIVGRRSFGKGLVQKPFDFVDSSAMRLTIQRYYSPSGRCIQKPYEDYKSDYSQRYESGELFHEDSIKVSDSLKFKTDKGRIVYGGGGIIPDVFVPVDTTLNSKYYRNILRKGVLNSYSLKQIDGKRERFETKYGSFENFAQQYVIDSVRFNDFIAYATKKGVEENLEQIKRSKKLLKTYLKAYLARGVWGIDAFYYISNQINPTFNRAVKSLSDGTYEKEALRY